MSIIRTTIRFEEDLHKKITELAEQSTRSFNNQCLYLIKKGIESEEKERSSNNDAK